MNRNPDQINPHYATRKIPSATGTPRNAPELRAFMNKCGMAGGQVKAPVTEKYFRPCATINFDQIRGNLHFSYAEVLGRQATGDRRQATGDRRQATGDRRQATGDRRQATGNIIHFF
jgi:hypothetical protein